MEFKVQFIPQYTFDDLVSPDGGRLRFDFAVFNKGLSHIIEYDGIQHFKAFDYFRGKLQTKSML